MLHAILILLWLDYLKEAEACWGPWSTAESNRPLFSAKREIEEEQTSFQADYCFSREDRRLTYMISSPSKEVSFPEI